MTSLETVTRREALEEAMRFKEQAAQGGPRLATGPLALSYGSSSPVCQCPRVLHEGLQAPKCSPSRSSSPEDFIAGFPVARLHLKLFVRGAGTQFFH